jgi:hypothetical protein
LVGIPLTIDLFGGSTPTDDQYQTWKVVHGYGVFLSFINYFFGLLIDRVELTRQHKEIASWSILMAGVFGGVARGVLVLFSALHEYGVYASLGEVVFITLGTVIFLSGLMNKQRYQSMTTSEVHRTLGEKDALSNLASDTSSK